MARVCACAQVIAADLYAVKMLRYLKKQADGHLLPPTVGKAFATANAEVEKEMRALGKRKRLPTHKYNDQLKLKLEGMQLRMGMLILKLNSVRI